jgi:hypothetical protein
MAAALILLIAILVLQWLYRLLFGATPVPTTTADEEDKDDGWQHVWVLVGVFALFGFGVLLNL